MIFVRVCPHLIQGFHPLLLLLLALVKIQRKVIQLCIIMMLCGISLHTCCKFVFMRLSYCTCAASTNTGWRFPSTIWKQFSRIFSTAPSCKSEHERAGGNSISCKSCKWHCIQYSCIRHYNNTRYTITHSQFAGGFALVFRFLNALIEDFMPTSSGGIVLSRDACILIAWQ